MLISYTLNQAEKVYRLAPEFMQSVSIRNLEEHHRWKQSMIPPSRTIAFTGTRKSPAALYQKLHADGVACIFGTLGNIDAQAASQGDEIYIKLIGEGVDIFATDRPLALLKILKSK
jgi:glycerophosphoryl diester phosphodiesterase